MRLRRRIVLAFVASSAVVVTAILVPLGIVIVRSQLTGYIEQRVRETRTVAASLSGLSLADKQEILTARYPAGGFTAGWLLATQQATQPTTSSAFPAQHGPEIEEARFGPDAHRVGPSPLGERLFIAVPVIARDRLEAILWVSSSLGPVNRLNSRSWLVVGIMALAGIVAALIAARLVASNISRRLESLADGAHRFAEGDLASRIEVDGTDEIAGLAAILNDMASRIAGLLQRERDFVDSAAHQLRTPLTAITIRMDRLRRRSDWLAVDAVEEIEEVAAETRRLAGLTERLLDLSGSTANGPDGVSVADAIELACRRVGPLAREQNVSLSVRSGADATGVVVSAGAFDEVLLNVLDNAVKFSPPGATVDVSAHSDAGQAHVIVTDSGPGVPVAVRDRVFEPFKRAGSQAGYGLGLTICARLCDAVGASIRLSDRDDGPGTIVSVTWPLRDG